MAATISLPVVARRVRVPGSSANLGPGFDTLAVALARYTTVEIAPATELAIEVHGETPKLRSGTEHFAVRIVREVLGHDRFRLKVDSNIPMTRGLGSSAALAVAAAAVAGHEDPMSFAAAKEGHADNAAASVLGGFVTGAMVNGVGVARRLPLDAEIRFVAVIPDRQLKTAEARRVLPKSMSVNDTVFQLGRMGQLIAGMADHRLLSHVSTQDRMHQQQRAKLFPEARAILQSMQDAGALATCWSGAGPTLLGFCVDSTSDAVRQAAAEALVEHRVDGVAEEIAPDLAGLVVES